MDEEGVEVSTLADIPIGKRGRVVRVRGGAELLRRLMDMGLVRGSEFKVLRNAPLEDPVEIEVKGYRLAIRRGEAGNVEVERV